MSETKYALIIANYHYEHPDLRQLVAPAQDAESLARVMGDPAICGFQVRTLINEPSHKLNLEIESFFDDRQRDDLLLLYFTGHGIKDADGQVYFATADTQFIQHNVRRATAVSAQFVNEVMSRNRARRQILLLDCCYSGAFKQGMLSKGDKRVGTAEQLEGRGRVVLTASDALQYSFEGGQVQGEGVRSVFTRTLVQGLESGAADLDRDGLISLDEVYDYVYEKVADEQPEQKPTKMGYAEGKIFIGKNPRPVAGQLPAELQDSIEDRRPWVRIGAVQELEKLLRTDNKGLKLAAEAALLSLAKGDDSVQVITAATKCLADRADLQVSAEKSVERSGNAGGEIPARDINLKAETRPSSREKAEEHASETVRPAEAELYALRGINADAAPDSPSFRLLNGTRLLILLGALLVVGVIAVIFFRSPASPKTQIASNSSPSSGNNGPALPDPDRAKGESLPNSSSKNPSSPPPASTSQKGQKMLPQQSSDVQASAKSLQEQTTAPDSGLRAEQPAAMQTLTVGDPIPIRILENPSGVEMLSWSPDGETLASAGCYLKIRLWAVANWKLVHSLKGHDGCVNAVAWSRDGKILASGGRDGAILLWDVAREKILDTLHIDHSVTSLAWSPDGKTLASASFGPTIQLWTGTQAPVHTLEGHQDVVRCVAWSPDGKRLASASNDRTVGVWDATTGERQFTLVGHHRQVATVAWSPDGKSLASGGVDQTILLWNAADGRLLRALEGHKGTVNSVEWSKDGRTLVSGADDYSILLWDVATGKSIRSLLGHTDHVEAVTWSPDGKTLASTGDHTIRLWAPFGK